MNQENISKRPLSEFSDDEVIELWREHGENATTFAAKYGFASSSVRTRLAQIGVQSSRFSAAAVNREKMARLRALDDALEAKGIDPRDVDIRSAKIANGSWDTTMKIKDEAGVEHVHTATNLRTGVEVIFQPKEASGPKWPFILPAPKQIIRSYKGGIATARSGHQRVLIVPDAQIGYLRHLVTDTLEPFHDVKAISLLMQIIRDFKPHRIVILGDFLDCASLSKYLQIAEFQLTLQPSIYYAGWLLGLIRATAGPECEIDYLAGNHERRLSEYIARNALAASMLRRAPSE